LHNGEELDEQIVEELSMQEKRVAFDDDSVDEDLLN
jgi:hypothetical protein